MSYTIRRTDGQILATIADGTYNDTDTSLTLVGRNYANYGQIMTNNLVRLLENSSYNIEPSNPLSGQLWWDSGNNLLKVYNGNEWKIVGSCTSQNTAPSTVIPGDLWWDQNDEQLYVYNGTAPYSSAGWILAGPVYPKAHKTGALVESILDTLSQTHYVISVWADNTRVAIISSDAFTPGTAIGGFSSIGVGHNLASGNTLWGTANNASYLGNQPAANYLRSDISDSTTGTLSILNDEGLTIGAGANLNISTIGDDATITNTYNGGNVSILATVSGSLNRYLLINGKNGTVQVAAKPTTALGIATKSYVDDSFINANLWGISTAITAPAGTSNTMIATTEFVASGLSGIFKYKIYDANTHYWVTSSPTPSANLVVGGTLVMLATSSGVALQNGATAYTQSQVYNGVGNTTIATTSYTKTATQWWGGSAKFVSTSSPDSGQGNNGDFWFQITS